MLLKDAVVTLFSAMMCTSNSLSIRPRGDIEGREHRNQLGAFRYRMLMPGHSVSFGDSGW